MLAELHARNSRFDGSRVALDIARRLGVERVELTHRPFHEQVDDFASRLLAGGFRGGQPIAGQRENAHAQATLRGDREKFSASRPIGPVQPIEHGRISGLNLNC